MKKPIFVCVLLFCVFVCRAMSQDASSPAHPPANPYGPTIDRLDSLTHVWLGDWKMHADVPHPEDPRFDDSKWEVITLHNTAGDQRSDPPQWNGLRVLRRWITIPNDVQGYNVAGARVRLDLRFGSDGDAMITVFSNGSLVSRGDEDMQEPIPLTQNALPGQRFLIAARVNAGDVKTVLLHSELIFDPPAGRPDP